MKTSVKLAAATISLFCGVAHAGFITIGGQNNGSNGQVSLLSGACTVDFNNGSASNACGATYTTNTPSNNFVSGTTNVYASPAGDSSGYFAVGTTLGNSVAIDIDHNVNYFGFLTGSLDSYNMVKFYLNNVLVDQFSGTDINAIAFPGNPTDGDRAKSAYVNYFTTVNGVQAFFNRIVYSSNGDSFETDNHTFATAMPSSIPEPSTLALLGLAGLGLVFGRAAIGRKSAARS